MTKTKKNYANRPAETFNKWRTLFMIIVCKFFYMIRFKLIYRLQVEGLENVPTNNEYMVCPNHLSTLDPPLMCAVMPRSVAFMAKQELFDIKFLRWWIDWLGAIAVNRESLGPSTVKTVKNIKKSEWVLGIFPEGTRGVSGFISDVNKGFTGLAKLTKCNILPVGIVGTNAAKWIPFSGKITVKIGKPIPYTEDPEVIIQKWIEAVEELTGFSYQERLAMQS